MQLVMGGVNQVWLREILDRSVGHCRSIRAAVAYAQNGHDFFDRCRTLTDVHLTFYGLLDFEGAVSTSLLADLLDRGPSRVTCRLVYGSFHPKVIWWEGFGVYIGSANLTTAAWQSNVECGVFYPEDEMKSEGIDAELTTMFDYLAEKSVPLTRELLHKLEEVKRALAPLEREARETRARLEKLFDDVPKHKGPTLVLAHGQRENRARVEFMKEWNLTLELLRGLAKEFEKMNLRPRWVSADANRTVHFDQLLHAYYYQYVREQDSDDEDDNSGVHKVEQSYRRNCNRKKAALQEAAEFWAALPTAPYEEDSFISVEAPRMESLFSRQGIRDMTMDTFAEAMTSVNAFRMHARQQKNSDYGLPQGHRESKLERSRRLAHRLWQQKTASGKTVRDILEHLIWSESTEMAQRLWTCTHDEAWSLDHLGRSTLGEIVGWARPNDYPPRNNRTNKALRALGHDVRLFDG